MCKIAVSLLEMDYGHLDRGLKEIEAAGADYVHFDMMDGAFVQNLGIGTRLIQGVRSSSHLVYDVHLMIEEPEKHVDRIAQAGADVITVHYEACSDVKAVLDRIRRLGLRAGLALKPETSLEVLDRELLTRVDVVHLMTTHPGLEGQTFIPESLDKISRLRRFLDEWKPDCEIEVDGNITMGNVQSVAAAGATVLVSGRALVQGDITENIRRMKEAAREAAYRPLKGYGRQSRKEEAV